MIAFLAQTVVNEESFVVRYFSFILLGLMLCIGYAVLRLIPKKKPLHEGEVEGMLREAEAEARRRAAERHDALPRVAQSAPPPPPPPGDLLGLTPEQSIEQERLRRMVASDDLKSPQPDASSNNLPPKNL